MATSRNWTRPILERIEVLRGANALRFGGSTLGGAVNGITPTGRPRGRERPRSTAEASTPCAAWPRSAPTSEWGDAWVALNGDRSDGDRDHAHRDALRFNGNIGLKRGGLQTRFYASVQSIDQQLPGALTFADATTTPRPAVLSATSSATSIPSRLQNRTTFELGVGGAEVGGVRQRQEPVPSDLPGRRPGIDRLGRVRPPHMAFGRVRR